MRASADHQETAAVFRRFFEQIMTKTHSELLVCKYSDSWQLFVALKSNQIKSLLLSHHHSTSALVSEILMSVLQTVQKNNNNNLHMDSTYLQTVQKTMCKIHIHILSTHSVL